MKFSNWKLDKLENIHFKEFFDLIENNRNRIIKTFPITVSNCIDLKTTEEFISKNIQLEIEKTGYYFYVRNLETNFLIGYIGIKKKIITFQNANYFILLTKILKAKELFQKQFLK